MAATGHLADRLLMAAQLADIPIEQEGELKLMITGAAN
jgi:hypothetical protein